MFELNRLDPADDDFAFEQTLDELAGTIEDIEDLSPAFRITDKWHIEDNLTLPQQMGVAKVTP